MRDIVVGVDGSPAARQALDRGLRMGQATGRAVRVVHAWNVPLPTGVGLGVGYMYDVVQAREDALRAAEELLEEEVSAGLGRLAGDAAVRVRPVAREGTAPGVLAEEGKDAATVVLGTRGHGRLAGLLGTAVPHVLHHASCPVLVVPETAISGEPFRKVVVGFDGSESARSALLWALEMATVDRAPVVVLHAGGGEVLETVDHWRREVRYCAPQLDPNRVTVKVVPGRPDAALASAVGPRDLLVVGSRGTGGFTGLLLGSVSAYCVSYPIASVAVVRAHGERLDDLEPVASGSAAREDDLG